ncbi:MAG TPA: hypothetical protein VN838_23935 [Bradyrhizobium sp.]|nr:hypothetical protein [Bradyrhizobium sp.]
MAGIVKLTFEDAEFTGGITSIAVNGGTIVLEANPTLSLNGNFPATGLAIATGAININGQPDAAVSGTISFPVNATSNAPTVTVNNFSGSATISWGMQNQAVFSGAPITLNGFSN